MHGSGPWKARRAILIAGRRLCGPLVMLAALAACDIGEAPTDPAAPGDPTATEAAGGERDEIRSERPPDDPRAWVFEELPAPGAILDELEVGECVLHYRRWNGKYSPVPHRLRYREQEPDAPGFRAVVNLKRGDDLDVQASCVLPRGEEAGAEAVRDLERRIREPGFVRGPEGNLQVYTPAPEETAAGPFIADAWNALAMRMPPRLLLPAALHATQAPPAPPEPPEGCLDWEEDENGNYLHCTLWDMPPIGGGGGGGGEPGPCDDDPDLEWDPATQECVCSNGLDPENGCSTPDPPPDPPPGGGGPGDGGDGGGDPPPPPCQDPEQDILVQEYLDDPNVTILPDCGDFTDSGATAYFSWAELNGRGPAGSPPWGNLHWDNGKWGMVKSSLTAGLDATRVHYGKPIVLTGGYRCPHGNALISGASPTSWHVHGRAADLRSEEQFWTMAECGALRTIIENQTNTVELLQCDTYGQPGYLHAAW